MQKSIFEYDDYRAFLRDYYEFSKTQSSKFSYRYFARLGGFKSGNILKIVIDGEINILDDTIIKFCKALKFNGEEAKFFKNLVLFNQAVNTEEKNRYSKELLRSKTYKKMYPLSEMQYHYFDLWYFPVVRGLIALPDFIEDPKWIADKIVPNITPSQALQALKELSELGLIKRNEFGRLTQSSPTITTTNSIVSSSLAHYHREMLIKASEGIDRFPRSKRDFSAMTLEISTETLQQIKNLTEQYRRDVIELASRDSNQNAVFQLNVYLFPVTQLHDKKEETSK